MTLGYPRGSATEVAALDISKRLDESSLTPVIPQRSCRSASSSLLDQLAHRTHEMSGAAWPQPSMLIISMTASTSQERIIDKIRSLR